MATNTWVALDKKTVSGSAVASVEFTGIDQTYTDLVITITSISSNLDDIAMQLGNGSFDTSSNYSTTFLYNDSGSGSGVSGRTSNATSMTIADSGTAWSTSTLQFQNYTNTNINKSVLCQTGSGSWATFIKAGLWRNTNAIERIKLSHSGNFSVGSTFSLYGIRAEGVSPAPKATGGAIYSDSTYYYHVFGSTGVFTPTQSISADVLCVAGGGGGGTANRGGGGGAGGIIYFAGQSLTATGYAVTVGAGGAQFGQGNNSQFASLTVASGGGRGGASNFGGAYLATAGGSGGGNGNDGTNNGGASNQSGTGATAFYGNRGGNVTISGDVAGGGGSGAAGTDGVNTNNGIAGGVGTNAFTSWGLATGVGQFANDTYYLAAGGNGGANYSGGGLLLDTRPFGGGGANSATLSVASGVGNTGSGGSGFSYNSGAGTYPAGYGGSGVIIVRYAK